MASIMIPPFNLEMNVIGHCRDQAIQQVWHLRCEAMPTEPTLTDLEVAAEMVGVFGGQWLTNILPFLQEDYEADVLAMRMIQDIPVLPVTAWKYLYDAQVGFPTTAIGGAAGELGSIFECATVRLRTALRSRRGRGSKRHSPVVNSNIINNEVISTFRDDLADAYNAFIGGIVTAYAASPVNPSTSYLTVASFPNYAEGAGNYFTRVTTASVNINAGSQVSRKRKGGYH